MQRKKFRAFLPVLFLFIILNGMFISGRPYLSRWHASQDVLIWGNLLLFLITLGSFFIAQKGLKSANPHAFTRSVYGSILLKLFVCMIAAFLYIAIYKKELNKPAFFACMGLYLIYTFLEVTGLMKLLKEKV